MLIEKSDDGEDELSRTFERGERGYKHFQAEKVVVSSHSTPKIHPENRNANDCLVSPTDATFSDSSKQRFLTDESS